MVHQSPLTLAALKTVTLLLGGAITYFALRAYRRTDARPLGALAVGFGVVTTGAAVAGLLDRLSALEPLTVLVVESVFTVVGFAVILYSLYTD
jgi:hypothetical protein